MHLQGFGLLRRGVVCYAVGIASAFLALGLRAWIAPYSGDRFPLIFAFIAVILVADYCGYRPAVVAAILSALGGVLFFHDVNFLPDRESVGLLPFLIGSFLAIALIEAIGRARLRSLEHQMRLEVEAAQRGRDQAFSAQLRAIVESSEDAIVSMDLLGTITSWNRAAARIFGYSVGEAVGQSVTMLAAPERAEEEAGILARIRDGGRVNSFETVHLNRNGARIQVSLTVSPIHDPAGKLEGISYIARDITERKAFEKRMLERQRLESLGVLAGGLAHDFNNLLTSIMGNASLVHDKVTDIAARERLQSVLRAGEHAALLVRQMLAFAGKGAFVIRKLDLSREIEEMTPLIRTAVKRAVALEFQLARDLPPVEADSSQFRQLVMNLVVNAAESIERRGAISIVTWADEGKAASVLEVRDNGCGMDETTKERIFDPFFTTKFTGRGLGLAAAAGIVRACHGGIEAESEPGQGSTFRVWLPAAR